MTATSKDLPEGIFPVSTTSSKKQTNNKTFATYVNGSTENSIIFLKPKIEVFGSTKAQGTFQNLVLYFVVHDNKKCIGKGRRTTLKDIHTRGQNFKYSSST